MGLSSFAIRRPGATLILTALVLVAAAPGVVRLELRTDGRALIPAHDPGVLIDREIRQRFDLRDPIIVVLRTGRAEGVYDPEVLRFVRDLTTDLEELDGVRPHDLTSLATEIGLGFKKQGFGYRTLLDPLPETEAELEGLRDDIERIGLYRGTLISDDGSAAAVMLATPARGDRIALYHEVRRRAESASRNRWQVDVLGPPVAEALLGSHILADLGVPESWLGIEPDRTGARGPGLVFWALTAMAGVFLATFRRPVAALMPLFEAGACLLFVFGVMGWLGAPIYIPTVVLPVILTAVGVADEIHIFHRYRTLAGRDSSSTARQLVTQTMADMTPPVVRTSLTTAAAFLAFAASPLPPVQLFGVFTALGVLACLVWSLTVVPACLVLLPRGWWGKGGERSGRQFAALARFAARRSRQIAVAASLLVLVTLVAAARLRVQDSWESGFAADSELALATRWFDDHFLGSHQLLLEVGREPIRLTGMPSVSEAGPDEETEPFTDPEILRLVGDLEAYLRSQDAVGGVLGPASYLETASFFLRPTSEDSRQLPDSSDKARGLWNIYTMSRGPEHLQRLVDQGYEHGVVTAYVGGSNYAATRQLMARIRDWAHEHLQPHGLSLRFGGDLAVSTRLVKAVVSSQLRSLLVSLLLVVIIAGVTLRRWDWGLLCTLPPLLAVLFNFAIMGWTGMPLGVATSMFAGMTLGVGVDYSIHVLTRYGRELEAGAGWQDSLAEALRQTGPAILIDACAVGLGFGLLVFSTVPGNARLGTLLALSVLHCLLASLLLLPAALALMAPRRSPDEAPGASRA